MLPWWLLILLPLIAVGAIGGLLKPLMVEWLWVSLSLLAGAVALALMGWFCTFVRVVEVPIRTVGPYWWVSLPDGGATFLDATVVIASGEVDVGHGAQFSLATKSGGAYFESAAPTVHVFAVVDPFARFRAKPRSEPLPRATDWLQVLCETVATNTLYEGRTSVRSAERTVVVDQLTAEGLLAADVSEAITLAEEHGLVRRRSARGRIALSVAGWVWLRVTQLLENELDERATSADSLSKEDILETIREGLSTAVLEPSVGPADFPAWVAVLVGRFKSAIETNDAHTLLWLPSGESRDEREVQSLAQTIFTAYSTAANVDLTREANAGDGPVDFKFSQGWSKRALIEVKLLRSSHLYAGAARQLPRYMTTEGIACGFYLCVGFTDSDLSPKRLDRVRRECSEAAAELGYDITPIFVDARLRPSASLL